MSTKYKILFAWDVQHDYYAGLKCTDFDTVPSPATASLMKQHQLLLRAVGNKWIVLTKVNANDQPQSPLRPEQKLVFYQRLGKPLFMEVTNLNRALLASQRFYFTNLHQNKRDNALYLTSAIPVYTDAAAYETGQFVANGSGTVFEALRAKAAGHTHATTDTDFWVSKGDFQYVESSDMIAPVAMVANYNVPAATQFDVRIYTLDTVQNTYTKLAKSYHEKRNEAVGRLQIDLRGMEPGRYRIEINGTAFEVYADNDCTMGNCFGIVEIFNHLPGSSDFALLDTHGRVKDTKVGDKPVWLNFLIRYANRRTFWKYITRAAKPPGTPLINSIKRMGAPGTDPPAFDAFSCDPVGAPTRKDYFVSKTLLALTEATDHNNFEITFTDVTYGAVAAPKPNLALSGSITRPPTESNFYCNIYLNY